MSYFVYMLGSYKNYKLRTYVGYTNNLKKRLDLHNRGKGAKSTKGRSWKIIYSERHFTRNKALSREYYIKKNRRTRNLIKKLYK